ncbi:YegP family protein [Desulfomicrobium sp. ZS1]|uniref:YegP family protein n=1 Tax=Desulfomicrobium sp. ZS1 TaxID=2952228 RepID=UPI0020B2BB96|nr:YegP family protein [Desulfomicrobium sp. ZS1]UTF50863.1 YegP family protein [Desulfomicrobium sp. ZS1]
MAGKFEMYKDKAGEFRFRLKAGNGQIILGSEGYKDKSGCKNGIESVKKNAADEGRFKKIDTKSGKFAFSLLAANHQVIGTSQQYETVASRDNGIQSVMTNAPEAAVVEVEA